MKTENFEILSDLKKRILNQKIYLGQTEFTYRVESRVQTILKDIYRLWSKKCDL